MQHPHEVDMVLAILDTQEIMVYGRDLLRPMMADGEDVPTSVARIPIRHPRVCGCPQGLLCRVRERDLGQGPRGWTPDPSSGTGHGRRPAPQPGVSSPDA
jgi:hypothetical protein